MAKQASVIRSCCMIGRHGPEISLAMAGEAATTFLNDVRDGSDSLPERDRVAFRARDLGDLAVASGSGCSHASIVAPQALQSAPKAMRGGRNVAHPGNRGYREAFSRMAIRAGGPKVRLAGRLVTGRAVLERWLPNALVARIARCLRVKVLQLAWVLEFHGQVGPEPVLIVAGAIGAKAAIVGAILDGPMAFDTGFIGQDAMVLDKEGIAM